MGKRKLKVEQDCRQPHRPIVDYRHLPDGPRTRLKFVWTCTDYVHHEHRWKWSAKLCALVQRWILHPAAAASSHTLTPLRISPGDILILHTNERTRMPHEMRLQIKDQLRAALPEGCRVVLLEGDWDLNVIEVSDIDG